MRLPVSVITSSTEPIITGMPGRNTETLTSMKPSGYMSMRCSRFASYGSIAPMQNSSQTAGIAQILRQDSSYGFSARARVLQRGRIKPGHEPYVHACLSVLSMLITLKSRSRSRGPPARPGQAPHDVSHLAHIIPQACPRTCETIKTILTLPHEPYTLGMKKRPQRMRAKHGTKHGTKSASLQAPRPQHTPRVIIRDHSHLFHCVVTALQWRLC